jgi:hypothetical protein
MFPDITRRPKGDVVVSTELLEDLEHGRGLTEAAISDRTRATYQYEFKRFEDWARGHKLTSLPTTPAIAATYLAHLSKRGGSPATLAIVRAAIKHYHATLPPKAKGRNLDLATPEIKRLFQGARRKAREAGRKTNKATPWPVQDFALLAYKLAGSSDLEDLRDLALIGLGIVRALRGPSELLTLDLGEARSDGARGALVLKREGATISLSVSKTKQTGDGEELPIEEGPALEAVRAWVQAAGIKPGTPLWRTLRKGHVQPERMHQKTLHNIIQRRAKQMLQTRGILAPEAAIKARKYSTHSLRRGALTSMGRGGATLAELIDLGRHSQKSSSIVLEYVEPGHVGAKAMRKLGM